MTVISDDVGEFEKAVQGSQLACGRILDWFHIAINFKAEQRSVFGSKMIASLKRESVETEITHPKWLRMAGIRKYLKLQILTNPGRPSL